MILLAYFGPNRCEVEQNHQQGFLEQCRPALWCEAWPSNLFVQKLELDLGGSLKTAPAGPSPTWHILFLTPYRLHAESNPSPSSSSKSATKASKATAAAPTKSKSTSALKSSGSKASTKDSQLSETESLEEILEEELESGGYLQEGEPGTATPGLGSLIHWFRCLPSAFSMQDLHSLWLSVACQ